jgi:hypothetical protein
MNVFGDRFDNAVSAAAEATRDRETEQAHGGEGREECEAEAYADTIGRLHQAYVFDGMVAMYVSGPHGSGIPELHVMPEYFDEHFSGRGGIEHENLPQQSCIRKSVMHDGVKIFCLENAQFAPVAA